MGITGPDREEVEVCREVNFGSPLAGVKPARGAASRPARSAVLGWGSGCPWMVRAGVARLVPPPGTLGRVARLR